MNSEMELGVGAKHDEVLGGMVVDSELTAFMPAEQAHIESQADDAVKISRFE